MATVTNNLTRIHDAEGSLTTGNIPSGGAGAAANTDIYLQGSQSLGKRITETAGPAGFALVDGADNDCSAADVHVGMWIWVTHYAILDALRVTASTGTTPSTNYDYWDVPLTEYPVLGGFKRVWVDVSVPTGATGSGLTESQLRCYGVMVSFSAAPGGNAPNVILDSADFVTGAALTLTGTSGLWSDFATADENTSNQYGVFRTAGGIYNCLARVALGSASSLAFDDSNFVIVFPVQSLVGSAWMGVSIDLQHASTDVNWSGGVLSSASSSGNQGDLVVSGTSGVLTASGMTFLRLRVVTLTSACSVTNSAFVGCGQITALGSTLTDASVSGYEGTANTSALVWDVATDPDGLLDGCSFTKGTAATHAIELGTTSPTTINLNDMTFVGYNASNSQNDSVIHVKRTSGAVTIYANNCTGTVSYRSDGATVSVVADSVSVTAKVTTATGTPIQSAVVMVKAANGTGPMPFEESVTIANSGTTATVAHTGHGMATNDKVLISGASHLANNGIFTITVTGTDEYTYTMGSSPGSNPTGTIISTFVALSGTTDVNGEISMSRVFTTDQPVIGWARKSSGSPYYKTGPINGTIDSALGATLSAVLVLDE